MRTNGLDTGLVGEVVEASTTDFLSQACRLDGAPPFGAFVHVPGGHDDVTILGVVTQVQTTGIDPGARAVMRGHGEIRDELIYRENPDLPLVLRTMFRVVVVGFDLEGTHRQFLPPRPARLHYSVYATPPKQVRAFTDTGLDYLRTLLSSPDTPVDELVAANIRLTGQLRGEPEAFTHSAGRELAELLRADYIRLAAVLRRCVGALEAPLAGP
ncbi:MAG TPA: hypothetical protein VFA49_08650 [Chloroflexota bacterium]|nr:hypothetical protein [Chloroflexota bacterium]